MLAVIFEAEAHDDKRQAYLEAGEKLRPLLEQVDGFISIERFESLALPGKILSLSFWRDEQAITRWRNLEMHRTIQASGRRSIFANYRLRVAQVKRDYGLTDRAEAPADSLKSHAVRQDQAISHGD